MNGKFRQDADYWDNKLSAYLHDPPDKALRISGHERRSANLLSAMGLEGALNKEAYRAADMIASGMDRMQFPGFSQDDEVSGAVDFADRPVITHPTAKSGQLAIDGVMPDIKTVHEAMTTLIRKDIDTLAGSLAGEHTDFAAARFHYVHHSLRHRLENENVGGLSGLWSKLPADTRIPDHSVWQHCALVSALYSCMQLSETRQASVMVFGITPVQDFIGRARKLRDFWTGSLILSWLAFEGIRHIMKRYGSDHVLYPSLVGQPLVEESLRAECHVLGRIDEKWKNNPVASFPNKFVCLVPAGEEEAVAKEIQDEITGAFLSLGRSVLDMVRKYGPVDTCLERMFDRQVREYFEYHWSACPLLDAGSRSCLETLQPSRIWERAFRLINDSKALPYPVHPKSALYGPTHAMAQAFLAAGKTSRTDGREPEQGIKCPLHGDLEILHLAHGTGQDKNPRPEDDPFWKPFKDAWASRQGATDFNPSERLSAVALVKRLAMYVIKKDSGHPLHPFFRNAESFPSTTEMAYKDWFGRLATEDRQAALMSFGDSWQSKLADCFHAMDEEGGSLPAGEERKFLGRRKLPERRDDDKYYAVLLMDGDRMGKLVNGETIAATWESVIHPYLAQKLRNWPEGDGFSRFWNDYLPTQRMLSPAVHAAISEALGDFALHTVPALVGRHRGRLIYAGGDDVCAILPLSTALQCARDIADAYNFAFVTIGQDGAVAPAKDVWKPRGRLFHHLGSGEGLSISASILIAHHKRSLTGALRRSHQLLERAKELGGRNCLALELDKRSGGSRTFLAQWDALPLDSLRLDNKTPLVESFQQLAALMGRKTWKDMSSSFVYSLERLHDGLLSMAQEAPEMTTKFLASQLGRSGENRNSGKDRELDLLAQSATALVVRGTDSAPEIDTTALIIARFVGGRMAEANMTTEDAHE